MKFELWYSVVVRDRHGKVISRERRRSRSFLKQWNQLMFVQMTDISLAGDLLLDINGVGRSCDPHANNFRMKPMVATGIICGTGATPVAIDDYMLEAVIANGVGPGQMSWGATTVGAVGLAGSHAQFVVSRTNVNNSGDTITVAEVGIYTSAYVSTSQYYMCGVRDVLGAPQDIINAASITVNYTLEVVA